MQIVANLLAAVHPVGAAAGIDDVGAVNELQITAAREAFQKHY